MIKSEQLFTIMQIVMKNLIKLAVLATIVVVSAFSFSSCSSVGAVAYDPCYPYGPVIVVSARPYGYYRYNRLPPPPPPRHYYHHYPYRRYRR